MNIENTSKKYSTSNKMVYSCQYHVIFCPKYRRPVLVEKYHSRLKEIFSEVSNRLKFSILEVEIMPDHVHLLLDVNPLLGIHKAVCQLKGKSSAMLRKEFPEIIRQLGCVWSGGKFISSVGSVSLETVKNYIINQKNQ